MIKLGQIQKRGQMIGGALQYVSIGRHRIGRTPQVLKNDAEIGSSIQIFRHPFQQISKPRGRIRQAIRQIGLNVQRREAHDRRHIVALAVLERMGVDLPRFAATADTMVGVCQAIQRRVVQWCQCGGGLEVRNRLGKSVKLN